MDDMNAPDGKWSLQQCPKCTRSFKVVGSTPRHRLDLMKRRRANGWLCEDCRPQPAVHEVTGCDDCLALNTNYDGGVHLWCNHPEEKCESIREGKNTETPPDWCPLRERPLLVRLKDPDDDQ